MENLTTTEHYYYTSTLPQEHGNSSSSHHDLSGLQDKLVLRYIIFTLAFTASIVIFVTSFKSNKILRCNRNVIMQHWSFIEIVHLIGHISSLLMIAPKDTCPKIFCILDEAEGILQCALYLMLLLLVLDSFGLRYESFRSKFKDAYKMLIGVIYLFAGLCFVIFTQFCGDCLYHNVPQNVAYFYFIFFTFAMGFNIFFLSQHIDVSYREEYPNMNVAIVDITLLMALPANIWNLASKHLDVNIKVVKYLFRGIEIFNPVVLLLVFVSVDKNFRAALCQILKCQCRRRQYIVNFKKNNLK